MVVTLLTWWLRTPTASIFSKQGRSFINNLLYLSLGSHIVPLLQCTVGPNSHKPTLIQMEGDKDSYLCWQECQRTLGHVIKLIQTGILIDVLCT